MLKTWVLVADKSRARFFSCDAPKGQLRELQDVVCPSARLHGNERFSDGSSRAHTSAHEHHTFPPEPDQDSDAIDFARDLAKRADDGRQRGDFERLILVTPPEFLGTLRKKLSRSTAKLVNRTIEKNLTHLGAEELRGHLPENL